MLARTLAEIIDRIRDAEGPALPPEVCERLAAAIGCDEVSVSLIGGDGPVIVGCSTARAGSIDAWQRILRQGPAYADDPEQVPVAPTHDPLSTPWPHLAARAFQLGVTAIGGVPLCVEDEGGDGDGGEGAGAAPRGGLLLLWCSRFAIDPSVLDDAHLLGRAVAPALTERWPDPTAEPASVPAAG